MGYWDRDPFGPTSMTESVGPTQARGYAGAMSGLDRIAKIKEEDEAEVAKRNQALALLGGSAWSMYQKQVSGDTASLLSDRVSIPDMVTIGKEEYDLGKDMAKFVTSDKYKDAGFLGRQVMPASQRVQVNPALPEKLAKDAATELADMPQTVGKSIVGKDWTATKGLKDMGIGAAAEGTKAGTIKGITDKATFQLSKEGLSKAQMAGKALGYAGGAINIGQAILDDEKRADKRVAQGLGGAATIAATAGLINPVLGATIGIGATAWDLLT